MSYTDYGAVDHLADLYRSLPGDPPDIDPAYRAGGAERRLHAVSEGGRGQPGTAEGQPPQRPDQAKGQRGPGGQDVGGAAVSRTSWTAPELLAATFAAPRWAVPGVLPEGATVLAGAPKVGKSWLALGLGVAVASGGVALGRVDVADCCGPVLYLALEDTARRLQARLETVLGDDPAPEGLTVATQCPALPHGGSERIAAWLVSHPGARLVIVDVFARVRGPAPSGVPAYDTDYAAVARAKRIADEHGVAMLLVHHTRQASAEDWMDTVSGTNGVIGAADTVAVLARSRGQADAVLHLTGRDLDDVEHALRFDPARGAWTMLEGPAQDYQMADTRRAILRYVRQHPGARPKPISTATGLSYDLTRRTCARMVTDGQMASDGSGGYTDPLRPVPAPTTPDDTGGSHCAP